ncbi:MAG TPA: 16S rRNA (cytidine(1402)-2'-O)-methyltransferase [Candidatus Faecivivens stercoripullorum]|uniref:Ribosomal RNA small subunit methyltransferase I n=1 Tax=Candidatus Faecivivens stercoripullorum TaxID=2840805 RepID=A0A9D1KS81_9FIRM|nr:16S rRNA (cytidine(1402)-2'-O)-methyltransferase [Candidatus Faecivivens stercoripullorum]
MPGIIYIVGTPIGNLSDFSPRAIQTLREVDFIAAEDTRVTLKLLNHFDIRKPLVSYHEHNLRERGEAIIQRVLDGENVAVVSDAGMPCVSDPGEDIVRLAAEADIQTIVIPGPSAAISALCISGLSTSRFSFEGFLSTNRKNRREHLQSLIGNTHTLIFYEAPHKLLDTLKDMASTFGADRKISLCREMTKIHEQVFRTTLEEAIQYYSENTPKGEFVLILEGAQKPVEPEITFEQAVEEAAQLVESGVRVADAAKQVSAHTPFKKSEIYSALISISREE